jgi:membrane protein required for colicin V production
MNLIDIVVVGLCVLFGVLGVAKGMVRQLFSIGGLVLGHLAGIRFYGPAVSWLKLSFKYSEAAGYAIVFLAVFLLCLLLGMFIEGRIRASKLSVVDRIGGLALGLAKGALLSVLLVFLLVIFLPGDASVLRGSKAVPHAVSAGRWLAEAFPDRIADMFREKVRAAEKLPPGGPSRK